MAVSRLNSTAANTRAVNAAKVVGRMSHIDSLLTRLGTVTQNEELAGAMLERFLLNDPALGQTLPIAVAKYSEETKNPIPGSLAEAVETLTYPTVRKLVQIVGLSLVFRELGARASLNPQQLMNQAVAVAVGAEYLARMIDQPAHVAFSAGLFANVGVAALAVSEGQYASIMSSVGGGNVQLHECEQQLLGCSHPAVGGFLLSDHGFPENVSSAAGNHTDLASASALVRAVALAESFAHQLGYDGGFAIVPPPFQDDLLASFGCGESDAAALAEIVTRWNGLTSKMLA